MTARAVGRPGVRMSTEVRVGIIAGSAQIVAALVALFGVLVTADETGAAQTPGAGSPTSPAISARLAENLPCPEIVERYRRLVLLDSKVLAVLVTAGPDGISPVEADPEARRCGVSETVLRAMR